jgi:hypothetical protein
VSELQDPEDKKLVTLARATRLRAKAAEGAAIRDLDGRTYAAATVDLPSLRVSAVGAAIAMAVASGAQGLEAVVVLSETAVADEDVSAVREFARGDVAIYRGTPSGNIEETLAF